MMCRSRQAGVLRSALVHALLLSLLLIGSNGCRRERDAAVSTATADAAATPQEGGTLVRRIEADVDTLNMALIGSGPEKQVLSFIHDALVDVNERLELIPGIAEKWEISEDKRSYIFHLNPRANFSDGTPVRASDVVYTLKTIADPSTESAQLSGYFEGLDLARTRAIDEHTVEVAFDRARASQLAAFNIGILPEHFYGKGDFKNDFNDVVLGTGPYVLVRRDAGQQIILERRENYWRTKPFIQQIVFKVIPDDTVAWNAAKRGDIDETKMTSDQWQLERNRPEVVSTIDIKRFYSLDYNFIAWNNRNPILSDKRVRIALSMCLDRAAIINNVYFGTARIITGPFTPDQSAYDPDVPAIEYHPEEAARLLASIGWRDTNGDGVLDKDGRPLAIEVLLSAGNKTSNLQAQLFQDSLKKIGVRLDLARVDGATMISRALEGDYAATFLAWGLDLDPDPFSYFHSSQFPPNGMNIVYYANPEADRLMEQAREELDPDARIELYHQLHRVLAADQPYAWTVQPSLKWAVNKRIQGVRESNGLGLFLWHPGPYEWWIPLNARRNESAPGGGPPQ